MNDSIITEEARERCSRKSLREQLEEARRQMQRQSGKDDMKDIEENLTKESHEQL